MDRAIRCCQLAGEAVLTRLSAVASEIANAVPGDRIAFVPVLPTAPGPGTRLAPAIITKVGMDAVLPVGAVVLLGGVALDRILDQLAASDLAEVFDSAATGLAKALREKGNDCEVCMTRNQLPQGPDRKRFRRVVRSRSA